MEKIIDRWLLAAGGGLCVILIGLNVQLMFSNTRQVSEHSARVEHSYQVILGLERTLSLMKDAETGQRGYLISGEDHYLEPYKAAIRAIDGQVADVQTLIADNPAQMARLETVKEHLAKKLALLAENIVARRERGVEAARQTILNDRSKVEMDTLRLLVGDMIKVEQELLRGRASEAQRSYHWALGSGVLTGAAALVAIAAFIILLQRNLAARARAAAVIHSQRELLRVTLASIGDAIITTDVEGRVTSLNAVAELLTGWSHVDAVGAKVESVFNIVNEETRKPVENPSLRALREGAIVGLANHTVLIARDGTERPVDDSGSPIRNEHNNIVGCVLVFRDVTQRREAEAQISRRIGELAEGDRLKDEFLATLAHELRNPLAPLSNAIAVLKKAGNDPQLFQQTREMMERQLNQMVRLIDDLLDVSRISRGKLDLRIERVDLAAVMRQAVETCRPLADAARQKVVVAPLSQPVYLNADSVRLAQVVSNLVSNACKFTPAEGEIALSAAVQGSDVAISVRDNGIGIPADKLSEIFEMFVQVDRSLERAHSGLGIGLTLVRRLVEMHGGTVAAQSAGPGLGSVFTVRLPLAGNVAAAAAPPPDASAQNAAELRQPVRVLVVDDNEDSAETLSMLLQLDGNEVHVANDGAEAVDAAARLHPDIIFLDIGLPKLNGFEAARRIREMPWAASVLLVAVTGWGQQEDRLKSQAAGFDHHLVKPVDSTAVMQLIGKVGAPRT